jgi:TRAP transporter 4TM/12TM fusion protein
MSSDSRFTKQSLPYKMAAVLAITMCIACILWNIEAPTRLGFAVLTEQYMSFQLGLSITIAFILFDKNGTIKSRLNVPDLILATVGFVVLMYAALDFSDLLRNQSYRPPAITVIGTVVVVLVMEGIRRIVGKALFIIVSFFLIYALFADKVPGALIGKALSPVRLVQYAGFDPSAVFSSPLAVGTTIVLLFVLFGGLLFAAGGGAFFTDLAMAATGRSRGGSAKISIVASALFGSISGSAVSNVVTTGVVTIPLMQKGGFSKTDAGAIEAIASTGGQLTPPIMGAAAFLMAEYLNVSYMAVAAAAILPAIFYYFSVFLQVDLIAARDNITMVKGDTLNTREVLKKGWHFVIPFVVLLVALFWLDYNPQESALLASLVIILVGYLRGYCGNYLSIKKLTDVFIQTGISMVNLILILAAAGFIIGILNITGLGFALTLMLVNVVGDHLILLLLTSALICIFLGMGMPTSGVYVLLATLVAPSLVESGINPMAAHMFILYFGMMSMLTPPVAIAAFAAATIAKSDAISTGWASMRIGWAAYVIPLIFITTPTILLDGSALQIFIDIIKTTIGLASICIGIVGYLESHLKYKLRILFITLGAGCFPIGMITNNYWTNVNTLFCIISLTLAVFLIKTGRKTKNNRRK